MKTTYTFLLAGVCFLASLTTAAAPNTLYIIRSNLYSVETDGSTTLLDGDLTQYDPSFSNSLDGLDARKMSNPGENIGMSRDGYVLSVERRKTIVNTDTIFFKVWNLNAAKTYQLAFDATNLYQPGMIAFVEDSYLNTKTPIDLEGTSLLDFNIGASAASYASNRFTLIFMTPMGGTLPLTLLSMKAFEQNSAVTVQWQTGSENSVKYYTIERSTDSRNFTAIGEAAIKNFASNSYTFSDASPATGNNYYRIAIKSTDGSVSYSDVAVVVVSNGYQVMKVYPNPVNGNVIHILMNGHPSGTYHARLVNTLGKVMLTRQIQHTADGVENLELNNYIPPGIYQLEITDPGGRKNTISLYY